MLKQFPKFIYVRVEEPGQNEWLNAELTALEAIGDNGPTKVATYQLVDVNELSKRAVSKAVRNKTF